jgi:hypothetical protein
MHVNVWIDVCIDTLDDFDVYEICYYVNNEN